MKNKGRKIMKCICDCFFAAPNQKQKKVSLLKHLPKNNQTPKMNKQKYISHIMNGYKEK